MTITAVFIILYTIPSLIISPKNTLQGQLECTLMLKLTVLSPTNRVTSSLCYHQIPVHQEIIYFHLLTVFRSIHNSSNHCHFHSKSNIVKLSGVLHTSSMALGGVCFYDFYYLDPIQSPRKAN
jgi:hypothetical protein